MTTAIRHLARTVLAVFVLAIAFMPPSSAQTPPALPKDPCAGGKFREFDFWVGHWTVLRQDGGLAGHNTITNEEAGCAIVEHWTSQDGRTGQSLNFYDPTADRWRQIWVGLGIVLVAEGGLTDGAMVMEGPLQYLGTDRRTRLRGTWTRLPDGRVRQQFHESADGGKTWEPWFDGYYSRTETPP